ncbi:peptidoglycan-binding protein [Streptomyces sp. NPDC055796]
MADIQIDTSRLTVPSFSVPEAGIGPVDGSKSPPPTLTLPAPGTYHLRQDPSPASDVVFSVAVDGTLDFDAALDGIAEGRGTRLLTLHGLPVRVDGTALDHDLKLEAGQKPLKSDRPHDLSLLPCGQYRLGGGNGKLDFAVAVDGSVHAAADTAGYASTSGGTLTVHGRTIRIDGTALSHHVLPRGMAGADAFLPRETVNELTVLPGAGYWFQSGPGITADVTYGVDHGGDITVGPEFSGYATGDGSTLVLRGRTIRIDGTALSHDVLPRGLAGVDAFLPRETVNELTVLPASGYWFQSGTVTADVRYGVDAEGRVAVGPEFSGYAGGDGSTLVLRGRTIRIDGTALSHDLLPLGLGGPLEWLPRASVNALTVLPASGYGFQTGPGIVADFWYGVDSGGRVTVGQEFSGFAAADGSTLLLRGRTIRIDGTALSHDLLPLGLARPFEWLPRATVNELTLLPADFYGFQPGPGVVADFHYGVDRDGHVFVACQYAGCAAGVGGTLALDGYPVVIDTNDADSDLVGIYNIQVSSPGPPPFRRGGREAQYVLLPAHGYVPRTTKGVFRRGFDVERDGTVVFPYSVAGRYAVSPPTSPNPSEEGQEVVLGAFVRPTDPDATDPAGPQGTVTFSLQGGPILGTAEPDQQGRAAVTTSALPLGESVIVVEYAGAGALAPEATTVRHHVIPRLGEPVADAAQPEVLEWALLPVLALMADPHAVDGHVKLAQCLLNAAGAAQPALVIDGNFGVLTLAAVQAFRSGPLLTPGDEVDTPVWFALAVAAPFPLLEPGPRLPPMTGPPVALVQRLLNRKGAEPQLDTDGAYGPATEAGVRDFQAAHGLATTGTMTPETWSALAGSPPDPDPTPAEPRAMRLKFSYDGADWAAGGPVVRFVSREDLEMTAPRGADPDDTPQGRSGFWYEVRDAAGRVLYRRSRHRPIEVVREVPHPEVGLSTMPIDSPRGTFELVAPVLREGATVVLLSSPPDAGRLTEAASEIFSLPIA